MIICDLDYREELIEENSIVGGVNATTNTSAYATNDSVYTSAHAFAFGDVTFSNAQTSAKVLPDYTEGEAHAYAIGKRGKNVAVSESDSYALFVG